MAKYICLHSTNAHSVAVVQAQENWLDVFKITKDVLLKDLETANSRFARKLQQLQQQPEAATAGGDAGDQQQADEPKTEDPDADVPVSLSNTCLPKTTILSCLISFFLYLDDRCGSSCCTDR